MYIPSKDHIFIVARTLLIQAAIFVALVASMWGFQKLYALTDQTVFPECYQVNYSPEMTEEEKGVQLLDALVNRMRYELDSTYGWSANDIIFNKWVMDNRAYRQFGTYVATKMLLDNYSTVIAKLGSSDRENENLYKARLNQFAFAPQRWGIFFIPSAEQAYKKGLSSIKKYQTDLLNKKAVYNARTDDIYEAFNVILGETVFGYALGLLQNSQNLSFYELDNKIYEVQGVILVVRDYLNALYTLYPEIAAKGNAENFAQAMSLLDKICTYDPLYITSTVNSGELIVSYLLFARNRISDIRDSIRI
ncbi:MAG: DUF2333 family protein [Mailhella sp.]|nr:DUF2333 family protein [Mailhella sp.]